MRGKLRLYIAYAPMVFFVCTVLQNVCCDDGLHCCHSGTVCDGLRKVCIPYPTRGSMSWSETTAPSNTMTETVVVVAGKRHQEEEEQEQTQLAAAASSLINSYCQDGSRCDGTCCLASVHPLEYRCCPYLSVRAFVLSPISPKL